MSVSRSIPVNESNLPEMMMPRLRLTSEVLQTVEDAASKGLTDRQIGKLLGVSRATISRHKIDNEAFETSLKKGRARGIEQVANAFFE